MTNTDFNNNVNNIRTTQIDSGYSATLADKMTMKKWKNAVSRSIYTTQDNVISTFKCFQFNYVEGTTCVDKNNLVNVNEKGDTNMKVGGI